VRRSDYIDLDRSSPRTRVAEKVSLRKVEKRDVTGGGGGGPLTIKRADMHMRRWCVGLLQSAATSLYIAEIISRSDWMVINGVLPRRAGFNAVTPRVVDSFSTCRYNIRHGHFHENKLKRLRHRIRFRIRKRMDLDKS